MASANSGCHFLFDIFCGLAGLYFSKEYFDFIFALPVMKPLFFLKSPKNTLVIGIAICLSAIISNDTLAQSKTAAPAQKKATPAKSSANQKAEFKGGDAKLTEYLKKNLRYPADPKRPKLTGTVTIHFVVEMDGNINDLQIVKGMGGDYDGEALRLLRDSPKWSPAIQNGQPVRSYLTLPISFSPKAK